MKSIEDLNNTCGAIAQLAVQIDTCDLRSKQELIQEKYDMLMKSIYSTILYRTYK